MKGSFLLPLVLALLSGYSSAQMPSESSPAPTGFDASGSSVKPQQQDPAHQGETPNPQLFGMELPLLDPSTDTVKYNGGLFDVGNNAAVRARFEKYLQQVPDDSTEAKRYQALIKSILKETQKAGRDKNYAVGGAVLIRVGMALYKADKYPGDGGQSGTLASAIVSALDSQRQMLQRIRENQEMEKEMRKLLTEADHWQNENNRRPSGGNSKDGKGGKSVGPGSNLLRIARNVKQSAKLEGSQAANEAANQAAVMSSKINYQSVLVTSSLAPAPTVMSSARAIQNSTSTRIPRPTNFSPAASVCPRRSTPWTPSPAMPVGTWIRLSNPFMGCWRVTNWERPPRG